VVHLGLKHVESLVDGREINFLLIAVGALLLMFGYRYYRMSIYFAGFMFGAAPVFHWTQMFLRPFTCMSISLATGIMTAAVALEIEALGVLMLGAMWGLVITYLFNGIFLSRVGYAMCACNAPLYAAMGVLVPLCAAIAYQVHQPRKMAASRTAVRQRYSPTRRRWGDTTSCEALFLSSTDILTSTVWPSSLAVFLATTGWLYAACRS